MDKLINKQLAKELEKSLLSELAELNIKGYQQYKVQFLDLVEPISICS